MKGYKVFNPDWTCRDFRYEVGKIYEMKEDISCCHNGFHFCTKLTDCFNYYRFDVDNKVAEIEALGKIDANDKDSKACTNKIKIVKELTWDEVLSLVNMGIGNTGNRNSGNCNSGDYNSGNCNSGNYNSGAFNTTEPTMRIFDHETDKSFDWWNNSNAHYILSNMPTKPIKMIDFIDSDDMTEKEKSEHPEYNTIGGYLNIYMSKDSRQEWYDKLSENKKQEIKAIPYFDADKFYTCTKIRV